VHALWLNDGYNIDPLTAIAAMGTAVDGLRFGTAIVTILPRHPLTLAGQAMTVQTATQNRFTLGIGPGHRHQVETKLGLRWDRPASYTEEYVRVLRPLLAGEETDFQGELLRAQGRLQFDGVAPPPVLVAALRPRMLRLAGEHADGTVVVWTGVRNVGEWIVPRVTEAAGRAGRPAPQVAVNVPLCITDDPEGTRAWSAQAFAVSKVVPTYRELFEREAGPGAGPENVVLVGDEAAVERQLRSYADAGATEFVAFPFGPDLPRTIAFLGEMNRLLS
jgi:F420-dependent oxidoreductase-like protein